MSKTRKISECVNVRINVGNYQHIEVTKYAEEEITYETKEELIEFENDLTTDLVNSLVRSMKSIPEQLGKGVENAQEVEESIATAIPEWLANSPIPNIANQAKKQNLKIAAQQKDNKDSQSDVLDVDEVVAEPTPEKPSEDVTEPSEDVTEPSEATTDLSDQDLFEDDEDPVASESEVEQETTSVEEQPEAVEEQPKVVEEKAEDANDTSTEKAVESDPFDFYGEDNDLFGD
jgi:hypothetical protein